MTRISKEELYLRMAEVAAQRSACNRAQIGAVITDVELRTVLSVGYNGPPRRLANACPGDPSTPGACGCVHAEVNALLKAPFGPELALFVTSSPCVNCAQLILNSGVRVVYYRHLYRLRAGLALLSEEGAIPTFQLPLEVAEFIAAR